MDEGPAEWEECITVQSEGDAGELQAGGRKVVSKPRRILIPEIFRHQVGRVTVVLYIDDQASAETSGRRGLGGELPGPSEACQAWQP